MSAVKGSSHCSHGACSTGTCSTSKKKEDDKVTFIEVLEKLSVVALAAFSCYCNWKLFVPFFGGGLVIGIASYFLEDKDFQQRRSASSCSQGFIEGAMGVKLTPLLSLAINIAVTVCHIDHHMRVFVPVVAVTVGACFGKYAAHYGSLLYRKFSHEPAKKVMPKITPPLSTST